MFWDSAASIIDGIGRLFKPDKHFTTPKKWARSRLPDGRWHVVDSGEYRTTYFGIPVGPIKKEISDWVYPPGGGRGGIAAVTASLPDDGIQLSGSADFDVGTFTGMVNLTPVQFVTTETDDSVAAQEEAVCADGRPIQQSSTSVACLYAGAQSKKGGVGIASRSSLKYLGQGFRLASGNAPYPPPLRSTDKVLKEYTFECYAEVACDITATRAPACASFKEPLKLSTGADPNFVDCGRNVFGAISRTALKVGGNITLTNPDEGETVLGNQKYGMDEKEVPEKVRKAAEKECETKGVALDAGEACGKSAADRERGQPLFVNRCCPY